MTQKPAFQKPSRKPRDEPAGLDTFASGAPAATLRAPAAQAAPASAEPEEEPEIHGMNVRFTPTEKKQLERLSKADARSQHQVLKRLLKPVLAQAVRQLDGAS